MNPRHQPRGDRFHVTLDTTDLACEQHTWMCLHLQRIPHKCRPVDVSIPMNLSVAQESGVLESRDQSQHAALVSELQVILKADEIVRIRAQIFLPQLHHCMRWLAGSRIPQTHRLHRTEA